MALEPTGCSLWTTHQEFHNLRFYFTETRPAMSLSILLQHWRRDALDGQGDASSRATMRSGCVLLPAADLLNFLTRGDAGLSARDRFLHWLVVGGEGGAPGTAWRMVDGPGGRPFLLVDYAAGEPGGGVDDLRRALEVAVAAPAVAPPAEEE